MEDYGSFQTSFKDETSYCTKTTLCEKTREGVVNSST